MRVNLDGNGWRQYDPESVMNTEGGINHGESVVQNARAIGEDVVHLAFDRTLMAPLAAENEGALSIIAALVLGFFWDLLEIIAFPFMLLKNLVDMAAHGVAAGVNAANGDSDGVAEAAQPFSFADSDSFVRLAWQRDRAGRSTRRDLSPLADLETAAARFARLNPEDPSVPVEDMANFNGDVAFRPLAAFRPGPRIEDLQNVMRRIARDYPPTTRIRAGGSRHSYGAIDGAGTVYVHPEGLRFIEREPDSLRADVEDREGLVRVGSGSRIRDVNARLWEWGRALPVLGGYDGQTFGGAIPTGTHGSVLSEGPIADGVRSIDLVRPDGTAMRIEPAGGITDPVAFRREHPDMELVQDDDVFHAAQINLGSFGVVHSYVMATVPSYHLREVHRESTVEEVQGILANGNIYHLLEDVTVPSWARATRGESLPGQHDEMLYSAAILFNPYTGRANVSTTTRTVLDPEPASLGRRVDYNLIASATRGNEGSRPAFSNWILNTFPRLTGAIAGGGSPGLVDTTVAGDDVYQDRSYNVFFSGEAMASVPARFCEFFIPLRGDMALRAMDVLSQAAQDWSEAHPGEYQTGPTSMRFVRGTEATLGLHEDYATFETLFPGPPDHAAAMMNFYRERMAEAFGTEFRMHLGQMAPGATAETFASPADLQRFADIAARFDPARQMTSPVIAPFLPASRAARSTSRGATGALAAPRTSAASARSSGPPR